MYSELRSYAITLGFRSIRLYMWAAEAYTTVERIGDRDAPISKAGPELGDGND